MNRKINKSDSNGKKGSPYAPTKTYQLRNGSNRNNFFQCLGSSDTQDSDYYTPGATGISSASTKPSASNMTPDALALSGAVKLPNGSYELNGMELSKEELDFVLENAAPQEASTSRKSAGRSARHGALSSSKKASFGSGSNARARQVKFRTNPSTPAEKALARFTEEALQPPASAANDSQAEEEQCSICLSPFNEESSYQTDKESARDLMGCVSLSLCRHTYHACCLLLVVAPDASSISCPNCKTIHGVLSGTQPEGGTMAVAHLQQSLPGHPKTKTIVVSYSFPRGVQGPEHPNPGVPYLLVAFPRVGYLPDTPKGNKVLSLLRKAFDRRLVFTVGTSATSGHSDCVVWNGIHHKTEFENFNGHGYPDPNYLDNVTLELASLGVTEDS